MLLQPRLEAMDMLNWKGFDRAIELGYTYTMERLEKIAAVAFNSVSSSKRGLGGRIPSKEKAGPVSGAGLAVHCCLLLAEACNHAPVPEHARHVVGGSIEAIQLAAVAVWRIFIEQVVDADRERPA